MSSSVFLRIKSALAMLVAALSVIASIFFLGRSKGISAAKKKAEDEAIAAWQTRVKRAREKKIVDEKIADLPDGDAAERLRDKWSRD